MVKIYYKVYQLNVVTTTSNIISLYSLPLKDQVLAFFAFDALSLQITKFIGNIFTRPKDI